jgi:cytochrome P450
MRLPVLRVFQTLIRWQWPIRLLNPLLGDFNPFLPEFRVDPYPFYRALQTKHRVYVSRALGGTYVLPHYDDVVSVLGDARFSVDRPQADLFRRLQPFRGLSPDFTRAILSALLMTDPPAHTRLRRLVNKAFTPRVVERLRTRVQALVDELLDAAAARGAMELVHDLAYPLPVIVIAELLGIPVDDRDSFKQWSDTLAVLLDPLQAVDGLAPTERAYGEIAAYMRPIFAERRRAPRDDLLSALVAVEERADGGTRRSCQPPAVMPSAPGTRTTTNRRQRGSALLRNPTKRRPCRINPSLIAPPRKSLRYDSPVQMTDRVATIDCGRRPPDPQGRGGRPIARAANRDPHTFPGPDVELGRCGQPSSLLATAPICPVRRRVSRPGSPRHAAAPLPDLTASTTRGNGSARQHAADGPAPVVAVTSRTDAAARRVTPDDRDSRPRADKADAAPARCRPDEIEAFGA